MLQARPGQRIGVMDIGAAQWRFNKGGQLSRIDLKLRSGVNRDAFERDLARELERDYPGRFLVGQPGDEDQESRTNSMSRAYRVNLTVLALVALFTGAFLVFSTQALAVIRRRSQFALLRVLGLERRALLRQVLIEGASLGVIGAAARHRRRLWRWPPRRCISSAATSAPATSPASIRRSNSRRSPRQSSSRWALASRCSAAWRRPGKRRAPRLPPRSSPAPTKPRCRAWTGSGPRCYASRWRRRCRRPRRYSSCRCSVIFPSACCWSAGSA